MNRPYEKFNELFQDLQDECTSFDQNKERKAINIAGKLRVILKDGPRKNTISVLTQLNKKDILFKDSAIKYNTNPSFSNFDISGNLSYSIIIPSRVYMGLIYNKMVTINCVNKFSCAPLFQSETLKPEINGKTFAEWWKQIIYEDPYSNFNLSRKKLILYCAEKDGSAHFAPKLPSNYEKFLQSDSLELIINGQKIKFSNSPAKNSIRQIGYEVIETLKENCSGILE